MSVHDSKIVKSEDLKPGEAKWIKTELITYTDPNQKTRLWEAASRPTRPKASPIDGVGIIAIFKPSAKPLPADISPLVKQVQESGKPSLLLQKQFRPPAGGVVIEVPAGLVDGGEDEVKAGVRELKEETGFVGNVPAKGEGGEQGVIMWNDPGFCTTNLRLVHLTIDLAKEENHNPKAQLEDSEFIECFAVPLAELYAECRKLEKEGYAIDARVGTLAEGIEVARRWGLKG